MTINAIQGAEATRKLANEGKFTLAIIKKIKGAKSGRYVEVEFEYSGCKYQVESKNESIPHSSIGEKIFIKFLPSRPSDYDTYEEILVPDSLLNIAPMVWDTLPVKEG